MRKIWLVLVAAVVAAGCELYGPDTPSVTSFTPFTVIQGPASLEVSDQGQFTVIYSDATGRTAMPVITTWTSRDESVLRIDRFSGAVTAIREGTTTVTVAVESASSSKVVSVVPKIQALAIAGLPALMAVGEFKDLTLVAIANRGNGYENVNAVDVLGSRATAIQWSSSTQTTLSVTDSAATPGLGIARALAPGAGAAQASVAGLTAVAATEIVGAATTTVSVTPGDLNGRFGFDLRRGAGDCGLGLRDAVTGSLDFSGVPASGRGGRARFDYGTIYDWLQLTVVLAASQDVLDFESEGLQANVNGYQVFLSGRLLVRNRTGFLRFYWVQIGQPRSSACASFEGSLSPR